MGYRWTGKDSREAVEMWVVNLIKKRLTHQAISSRLSAIRHMFKYQQIKIKFNTDRLNLILKGLKKRGQKKKVKKVVNIRVLRRLTVAAETRGAIDSERVKAMACMAFFGFLRPSEYCITGANHYLRKKDIQCGKNHCTLRLLSFKHSLAPAKVRISNRGARGLEPVDAIRKYCLSQDDRPRKEALFQITDIEFREELADLCLMAKIKGKITPHSFRHGGATWAGKQNWSDARIRAHGRWRSEAYKAYVKAA